MNVSYKDSSQGASMDDIDDLLEDEMLFGSSADLPHGLRFILMHVLAHADLPRE